jgi:hypothetical protein
MRSDPPYERLAVAVSVTALATLSGAAWAAGDWSAITKISTNAVGFMLETCDQPAITQTPLLVKEFSARVTLTWGIFVGLTTVLLVLGYCLTTSIYRAWISAKVPIVFIVGVVFGGIASIGYAWGLDPTKFGFPAYKNLFLCASEFANTGNERDFPLILVGNSLYVLATLTFVFSVWQSMLDLPHQLMARDGGDAKTTLQRKNEEIVWYLYVGSALLIASVVVLHSYYSWPAPLMGDPSSFRNLATIIAMFYGTGFSLLLVAVLGPAVVALKFRTQRIARNQFSEATAEQIEKWIRDNNLQPTGYQQGGRVLAVLGPLLAGPVLDLLRFAGG